MDQIVHTVRDQQWLDLIQQCNASGLTKKEWCKQNGIKLKTFYYHQRQLRHQAFLVKAEQNSHSAAVDGKNHICGGCYALYRSFGFCTGFNNKFLSGCSHPDAHLEN